MNAYESECIEKEKDIGELIIRNVLLNFSRNEMAGAITDMETFMVQQDWDD